MILEPDRLVADFRASAKRIGLVLTEDIQHEAQAAPHKPHGLRTGKCAVYVFTLSEKYGSGCPAGAHRVLKVGKAGPNSNPRFVSQHYTGSARSTLAGSLRGCTILWPYIGLTAEPASVADWMKEHCDRDNFYLAGADCDRALRALEVFLRGHLGPVYEGTTGRDEGPDSF